MRIEELSTEELDIISGGSGDYNGEKPRADSRASFIPPTYDSGDYNGDNPR
ncbi:hypothetical protein [Algicola sagamiensis]|uniref:hypothetical protein n=1 Tax=Algicola sagamiensis TaxID=163869 RepID=UPI00037717AD|nr:hypothetical protein [Algicola sagamiensis]